jgi:hypothetical protein
MESIIIENISPISPKEEAKVEENQWKSCCFTINPVATKYIVQVGILSSLIIYSAVMLVVNQDCQSQRNYGSLLMVCLGCFIPSPKMT